MVAGVPGVKQKSISKSSKSLSSNMTVPSMAILLCQILRLPCLDNCPGPGIFINEGLDVIISYNEISGSTYEGIVVTKSSNIVVKKNEARTAAGM